MNKPSITGKVSPADADYAELAEDFYFSILTDQPSCFKRDIIRDNRAGILASHIRRAKAYDALPHYPLPLVLTAPKGNSK